MKKNFNSVKECVPCKQGEDNSENSNINEFNFTNVNEQCQWTFLKSLQCYFNTIECHQLKFKFRLEALCLMLNFKTNNSSKPRVNENPSATVIKSESEKFTTAVQNQLVPPPTDHQSQSKLPVTAVENRPELPANAVENQPELPANSVENRPELPANSVENRPALTANAVENRSELTANADRNRSEPTANVDKNRSKLPATDIANDSKLLHTTVNKPAPVPMDEDSNIFIFINMTAPCYIGKLLNLEMQCNYTSESPVKLTDLSEDNITLLQFRVNGFERNLKESICFHHYEKLQKKIENTMPQSSQSSQKFFGFLAVTPQSTSDLSEVEFFTKTPLQHQLENMFLNLGLEHLQRGKLSNDRLKTKAIKSIQSVVDVFSPMINKHYSTQNNATEQQHWLLIKK
ncbi:hypothetical protein TKK_0010143 [Trichogramma kaykai]